MHTRLYSVKLRLKSKGFEKNYLGTSESEKDQPFSITAITNRLIRKEKMTKLSGCVQKKEC